MERFLTEMRFDDPGQPPPRWGGVNWMKVPLPDGLYINIYRSGGTGQLGAGVRFTAAEGASAYRDLLAEREAIDAEFGAQGLDVPTWTEGEVPHIGITTSAPQPWDDTAEAEQRRWLARAANQFVNSLRPRLQRLTQELAA